MKRTEIQIRDPFILPLPQEGLYYLYGTTDSDPWNSVGQGFDCYTSPDLENWQGPFPAFRRPDNFWGTHDFWAPEVHIYKGFYYMFATFIGKNRLRATQILKSTSPKGPFLPLGPKASTPRDWQCLDGTFYLDKMKNPWIIYCREWVKIHDGAIYAQPLSEDLSSLQGPPLLLFHASAVDWPRKLPRRDGSGLVDARVTDGPFLFRDDDGELFLLWSSLSENGYAQAVARSDNGEINGTWIHQSNLVITCDGGHGMIFRGLDTRKRITYHSPNETPNERFCYREIQRQGFEIKLNEDEKS